MVSVAFASGVDLCPHPAPGSISPTVRHHPEEPPAMASTSQSSSSNGQSNSSADMSRREWIDRLRATAVAVPVVAAVALTQSAAAGY
jgi:hypothetical protein